MPIFRCALAVGETAEGAEDFFTVELALFFAYAGDLAEFGEIAGPGLADKIESGVVENDEGGDHFFSGGVSAPFAEEFAQFFVDRNRRIQLVFRSFEGAAGILERCFGRALVDAGEPFRSAGADVADSAAIPLRDFAKVIADFFLPALLPTDEMLDLVVTTPGAVFFL